LNRTDVRVLRGGSWNYNASNARAPSRIDYYPDVQSSDAGLMCAR